LRQALQQQERTAVQAQVEGRLCRCAEAAQAEALVMRLPADKVRSRSARAKHWHCCGARGSLRAQQQKQQKGRNAGQRTRAPQPTEDRRTTKVEQKKRSQVSLDKVSGRQQSSALAASAARAAAAFFAKRRAPWQLSGSNGKRRTVPRRSPRNALRAFGLGSAKQGVRLEQAMQRRRQQHFHG
jgi:hypothetical protein